MSCDDFFERQVDRLAKENLEREEDSRPFFAEDARRLTNRKLVRNFIFDQIKNAAKKGLSGISFATLSNKEVENLRVLGYSVVETKPMLTNGSISSIQEFFVSW